MKIPTNTIELRANLVAIAFINTNCNLALMADQIQALHDVKRVREIKRYEGGKSSIIIDKRLHYNIDRAKNEINNIINNNGYAKPKQQGV